MVQVFLSHSSKQKGYVEVVAKYLGKFNVIYDAWTFEAGNKTLDEIYLGIDKSGLFVFFISDESLNSPWVGKEINKAEEYIKNGRIKKFLPIIIDNKITHSDSRIPDWIRDEYNVRFISKPTKTYDLIKQALRLVSWDLHPKRKEVDQLFIGRTSQIKQFEERIYDFDKPTPVTMIVSGLSSIGRRKFIRHALINSNKIRAQYSPPTVTLDSRSSIEDLIVRLYGLGYSELHIDNVTNLLTKTQEEKIVLASDLITELYHNNDILLLVDNLAIISKDGNVVDWFLPIIRQLEKLKGLAICLISQSRIRAKFFINNDLVFGIEIPELEPYERRAFFKSLLDIEKIEVASEDFKVICEQFKGFPEQIIYTTSLVMHEGVPAVLENPHEIIEYNTEKVAKLIKSFSNNEFALQILKILSESEFMSLNILEDILGEDMTEGKKIISQFSHEFIIEYVGNAKEFLRLNDSVKDYVQRLGYKLQDNYRENLQTHAKNAFKNYETIERDTSDYVISLKEVLKAGIDVPTQFLVPSHYVNAMRDLYNFDRRYKEVISLADRALTNEQYLDKRIVKEIRYWLCLALARRRDRRILQEVQKIDGVDHNFLLGFYYRIIGRHEDAIQRLNEVLADAPNFYRAKRELVQVYLNTEQFEEAYTLARENYHLDKNNPYNLQSYFRCLVKTQGAKQKDELKKLLGELKNNPHEKANEMYLTALAQFYAIVENSTSKALRTTDDAISTYPKNIYPYLSKLEILRKEGNISEIKKSLEDIESKFDGESDILTKLPYLACKCILLSSSGRKDLAMSILNKDVKNNFSNTIYKNLLVEIDNV